MTPADWCQEGEKSAIGGLGDPGTSAMLWRLLMTMVGSLPGLGLPQSGP